jgi:hypothetical protein
MTFEERQYVRQQRSDIQREKEVSARRLFVITPFRTKLYMGGGSRPLHEQIRSGYSNKYLPNE